jgi:hypothetical protein
VGLGRGVVEVSLGHYAAFKKYLIYHARMKEMLLYLSLVGFPDLTLVCIELNAKDIVVTTHVLFLKRYPEKSQPQSSKKNPIPIPAKER